MLLFVGWLAAAVWPSGPPPLFPPNDFTVYWSTGRLHLLGGNPYRAAELRPVQESGYHIFQEGATLMLWTPPWTLPLYWPAGALPVRAAQLLWMAVQAAGAAVAACWLWRGAGGATAGRAALVPLALVALYLPTRTMLQAGQIAGLLVLGLAGFVRAWRAGRHAEAGLWAALTAVKPHLLALWGLCFVLEGLFGRGRRELAFGVLAVAALGLLALLPNPDVYGQFLANSLNPEPGQVQASWWVTPTVGHRIRVAMTPAEAWNGNPAAGFAWQFAPLAAAAPLTVLYWWKRRRGWDWGVETPRLVAASVLVTPYGGWIFDLVVLLTAIVPAAALAARAPDAVAAVVGLLGLVVLAALPTVPGLMPGINEVVWFAPATLALAAGVALLARRRAEVPT